MEIIVGKTSGFCQGVAFTIKKATEYLNEANKNNEKLYCLGEIVHNERIIEKFKNDGLIFVNDLSEIPKGSKVIFRAHGERKEIYELAKERNIEVLDLTCGKVRAVKNKVVNANDDSIIIVFGKKDHPETVGTFSFCKDGFIIESEEDFEIVKNNISKYDKNKIFVVEQTTFNEELFNKFSNKLKDMFSDYEIIIEKTICNATHERQEETAKIAKDVDCMIIIGGKKSSNTKELYNVAKESCDNSFLMQDANDLNDIDLDFSKCDKVGIMAGASTPEDVVNEVIERL